MYICDPSDGEELLRNDGPYPHISGFDFFVAYRSKVRGDLYQGAQGKGLLGSHGPAWQEARRFVQQDMMRPRSALFYIDTVDTSSRQLGDLLGRSRGAGDAVVGDLLPHVYRWALESITSIFLNTRLGCLDQNPSADTETLINGANIILGPDMYRLITWPPFYKYVELPYFKRFDRACSDVYKLCSKYINEAGDKFDREGGQEGAGDRELSVMEKMFVRCGDNRDIPTVMAMDAMMAGVDTTGGAATFLLYHLAANEDKQELLYREIVDTIGPGTSDAVTEQKLKRMKYLRACAQESHRLRPVASGVGRRTQAPVVLSGYLVPPGVSVAYTAFVSAASESQVKSNSPL